MLSNCLCVPGLAGSPGSGCVAPLWPCAGPAMVAQGLCRPSPGQEHCGWERPLCRGAHSSLGALCPMASLLGSLCQLLQSPWHLWACTDSPAPGSAGLWASREAGQGWLWPPTGPEPRRRMELGHSQTQPRPKLASAARAAQGWAQRLALTNVLGPLPAVCVPPRAQSSLLSGPLACFQCLAQALLALPHKAWPESCPCTLSQAEMDTAGFCGRLSEASPAPCKLCQLP